MGKKYSKNLSAQRRRGPVLIGLITLLTALSVLSLFVGSSRMALSDGIRALFGKGTPANTRILYSIRLPRILAAIVAGAGLSVSGLIMQTILQNPMASPSTLGVSNAAVFGANVSIIAFAGGFLSTGHNVANYGTGANPFAVSGMAFLFAILSVLVTLGILRVRAFSPNAVVLSGIAIGAVFSAATTILQFYATDVGLSAAVIWNFGDLGRATYRTDLIMAVTVTVGSIVFFLFRYHYNVLLSGEEVGRSVGVSVGMLRFLSLLLCSVITAVCVSFLGVIGFIGIICPHITKKLLGHDHRVTIPVSIISGSVLLTAADTLSRTIGNGAALPVGAITAIFGAPFFIAVILAGGRHKNA